MTLDGEYREDLAVLVERISSLDPPDLDVRFASCFDLDAGSYLRVEPAQEGTIAAVDGSNAILLDAGLYLGRAPQGGGMRILCRLPSVSLCNPSPAGHPGAGRKGWQLLGLYRECFGRDPEATVRDDEPGRTAAVMRDTLEYWVALKAAERLSRSDLLVLDGALRVSHASHEPVLVQLIRTCAKKGIHLCAVTKRTAITWDGGLPLVPEPSPLRRAHSITPPWVLRVREEGLDLTPYLQWRHGAACVAALHPRSLPGL